MMKHVQKLSKIEGSVGSVSNNQFDPSTAQSSFVLCSELSFGLPLDDGERCRSAYLSRGDGVPRNAKVETC